MPMHYAVSVFGVGEYADPRVVAELAHEAEEVGWEGFFLLDHLATTSRPSYRATTAEPLGDPWIALAAVTART